MKSSISIHAPTRGATSASSPLLWYNIFQSTLPRGERRSTMCFRTQDINFNPRSHEGSDFHQLHTGTHPTYFNPRSHEGSDFPIHPLTPTPQYFNPRSHEGSDPSACSEESDRMNFNPRSHEGSDYKPLLFCHFF